MDFKNLKKTNQKSQDFWQMFVISKHIAKTLGKKSIGQPMENIWKIYSLAYEFSFFVISISALTFCIFYQNHRRHNQRSSIVRHVTGNDKDFLR